MASIFGHVGQQTGGNLYVAAAPTFQAAIQSAVADRATRHGCRREVRVLGVCLNGGDDVFRGHAPHKGLLSPPCQGTSVAYRGAA